MRTEHFKLASKLRLNQNQSYFLFLLPAYDFYTNDFVQIGFLYVQVYTKKLNLSVLRLLTKNGVSYA